MREAPVITKLDVIHFEHTIRDVGRDYNTFNMVYEAGGRSIQPGAILRVHTDKGIIGEYPGVIGPALAEIKAIASYLIGKEALAREPIYNDLKRGSRHWAMLGMGVVDICLWDIAGKFYDEPLYRLLGGEKRPLKAYASTLHGDENGGLTTPQDFEDFASQCLEMGYKAFKVHGWGLARDNIDREVANVLNLGEKFAGKLDLLIDPACEIRNFGDALKLGRACDEANFFWWEDPFQDNGVSQFAHRKLRQMVKTPILQTEHIRLLEQHVDFIVADATDYVRCGAHEDGGITGAMKIAHATEGFGLDVELHGPGPVHRHIMSAIRNTNFFELGLVHPNVKSTKAPVYINYNDDLDGIDSDGNVYAPDGPGIGVDLDWDWINAHKIGEEIIAGQSTI
ncbi:MAG: enolase C-terminal domain-like protein [SAR202 cluster bacterium]|jgi:L-alanine-DL-glutamate epimerase-like enolase superfamily enzyme|nr:enolase C-terminal domain-like protein [SAR202 cluster bacterium]|tara:strand:- start:6536 stop:7720 length:1185 start_codon:yes stop_codon:yes gene_type:complete